MLASLAGVGAVAAGAVAGAEIAADDDGGGGEPDVPPVARPDEPLPSNVVDLTRWKLSVPTDPDPTQVSQPKLASYTSGDFRVVSAVQFTAPVGGGIQPGSKYPRTELREVNRDGTLASWSTNSGTHVMELVQRITHVPAVKPEVVAGQIHDADEYVVLIRLNGRRLFVEYQDKSAGVLDESYVLGVEFTIKVIAAAGFIDVFYNGAQKVHQSDSRAGCYFKAGCYTQSSEATGDTPTDFGQVEITRLTISHT